MSSPIGSRRPWYRQAPACLPIASAPEAPDIALTEDLGPGGSADGPNMLDATIGAWSGERIPGACVLLFHVRPIAFGESARETWRLFPLRGWSNAKDNPVLPGGS